MPLNPASFLANEPPTAKQLNTALYTYTPGSSFTPTGILFHAHRPLLVEGLEQAVSLNSSSAGTTTSLSGSGNWKNYFDNTALFGGGADTLYNTAAGTFNPGVAGSAGTAGSAGGHFIIWGFPCFSATTNARGSGAYLNVSGTLVAGGKQLSSIAHDNSSYALDLVTTVSSQLTSLSSWIADPSGGTYAARFNLTDYSGETSRFCGFWGGILSNGSTVSSVPVIPSWTATSTVSSVALNNSAIGTPLNLLNDPPILRVGTNLNGTSILSGSLTTVPLASSQFDTYTAWNAGTSTYTVPVSGIYLVHGCVSYAVGTTNNVQAVISVGAVNIYGPAYQSVPSAITNCQVTRLLDLNAGDAVQLSTFTNGSNSLSTDLCRLVMIWLAGLGSGSTVSFTPPDTGYRWQAGTSGTNLTLAFQQHLSNDISFLVQRPYLLSYQGTAQTGLSQNAFHTITMDTVSGFVHGSAGDPYGGWHPGTANSYYAAPADGWYLAVAGYSQSALASGTAHCLAAILQSPAGSASPDQFQRISTTTTGLNPGSEAIGAYYLRAGDTLQPQYQQQNGGVTFSTTVTAGHQSSFGVVWLCE
jgi:hypothetical protein